MLLSLSLSTHLLISISDSYIFIFLLFLQTTSSTLLFAVQRKKYQRTLPRIT